MNVGELAHAIGRHVDPPADVFVAKHGFAQRGFQSRGHSGAGFAGTHDDNATDRAQIETLTGDIEPVVCQPDVFPHQPLGAHPLYAGLPDGPGIAP